MTLTPKQEELIKIYNSCGSLREIISKLLGKPCAKEIIIELSELKSLITAYLSDE